MVDVPPSRNLPEQANPWGRWIEDATQDQFGTLDNHQAQIGNLGKSLNATSADLGKKYQQLVQVTANLTQAVQNVAASGATWQGPVSTGGSGSFGSVNVTGNISSATSNVSGVATVGSLTNNGSETVAGTVTVNGGGGLRANGGIASTGVYSNLLSTNYRVQYVQDTGAMGYVPSSRRFKQDIVTAPKVDSTAIKLRVVNFRYIAAVKELGNAAAVEWGLIAEEVEDLGLDWLVDKDPDGTIMGVRYDRLPLALLQGIQAQQQQIQSLKSDLATLKKTLNL